jgi:orotate phosphoribosyltransferase
MTTNSTINAGDALRRLLRERSVKIGRFTLSSGRESTYYIDARATTMSAQGLALIGHLGLGAIRDAGWEGSAVGGLTLGADPVSYAIALASHESPPVIDAFTVRKEAKGHGRGRLIEGCFDPTTSVVVIEDVITTGGSALRAVEAIRGEGGRVSGVLAVVDREEGGAQTIEATGLSVRVLVRISELGITPR